VGFGGEFRHHLTQNFADFTGYTWGERFVDPGGLARKGRQMPKGSTSTRTTHWKFYGIVDFIPYMPI
jgi:hypothetical protein